MTTENGRSVAELRRESERTRAELTQTVEALRGEISETAAGVRRTIAPDNIKAEVSGYVADKSRGFVAALKQQAMDNPMQALAAGSALAVPALRLVRSIPLPLLMIGAGLALASPRVRNAVADKVADATGTSPEEALGKAQEMAGDRLRAATAATQDAAGQVRDAVESRMTQASEAATKVAADVKDRVAAGRDLMSDTLNAATQSASRALEIARAKSAETLVAARESASTAVRDNAVIVGGIGLAIGALLAASLPATRLERKTMGDASDGLRNKVSATADEALDKVKSAAMSAADDITAEVGKGIGRAGDAASEKLRTVSDEAITTAFEPTQSHR